MLSEKLQNKLTRWQAKGQTRARVAINNSVNSTIVVGANKYLNFTHNDYLGLSHHPKIIESFISGAKHYGFGSGASGVVSGYFDVQQMLETRFAEWLQVDRAILFNSGYLANIGVIAALLGRTDIVLADKYCHASLLDGIQQSRAKHYRYKHNSISDLVRLLKARKPDVVITESVFSMEGDIAPMQKIIAAANQHRASVIIDDSHGIGVLGKNGRGIYEEANIKQHQITCLIAPLGKAFNGMGAIVAGEKNTIETVLQFARTYRYTTALPPAVCLGLIAALDVIINETWRRNSLIELIYFFNEQAKKRGLPLRSTDITPIRAIVVGDNTRVMQLQKKTHEHGFYVAAIRPPTVPVGSARLRISLNCLHTKRQISALLDCIDRYFKC